MGLEEAKFWEMTVAEIQRYLEGAAWRLRTKAQFDYVLADLIGVSTARIVAKGASFPSIVEVYPSLFEEEMAVQQKEEQAMIQSQNRFLEFALKHNARMAEEGADKINDDNNRRIKGKDNG